MKVAALLLLVVIVAAHAAPYSNLAAKTCPTEVCDGKEIFLYVFKTIYEGTIIIYNLFRTYDSENICFS